MNAAELIRAQLALECIGLDEDGLLVRIPGSDPDQIARFYVYRHADGYTRFARHDVPPDIREQLLALAPETAFVDPSTVQRVLEQHRPSGGYAVGRSYVFPETLTPRDFPNVVQLDEIPDTPIDRFVPHLAASPSRPAQVVVVDGCIVSACVSARENEASAEAWVRTLPDFRRQSYARQTTAAWAHRIQQLGKVPFYSHYRDNLASQAVAQSLGLLRFADYANFL